MSDPTAAIIIIGDEILSGRTLDTNTNYIAGKLFENGIDLKEVRVIADNHQEIIATVSALRSKYTYIFTTGGIGPTHDDITSQAIADAFDVPLELNAEAFDIIKNFYLSQGKELNSARKKMAYLPKASTLINNPVSWAPGFRIDNVFVLAGVPNIMQAMFNHLLPTLQKGRILQSKNIDVLIGESTIAAEFASLQSKYPTVQMGSYPFKTDDRHGTSLVLSSKDYAKLAEAYFELESFIMQNFEDYITA
jgi:molybdenum cofactor synthesis domain-containing protein